MKNTPTPRQINERARRKAMPLALIQRPLKHIAERDHSRVTDIDGSTSIVMGPVYKEARQAADAGRGNVVTVLARMLA